MSLDARGISTCRESEGHRAAYHPDGQESLGKHRHGPGWVLARCGTLHGGFEGLRELGMSRAAIYRKTAMFRKLFGAHPDEYVLPGVEIDVEAYLKASRAAASTAKEDPIGLVANSGQRVRAHL